MTSREVRRPPSSGRALLLLAPLAVLATLLLGLLAQSALAGHDVEPPSGLTVSPGPVGTSATPTWTFDVPDDHTADCALVGPDGPIGVTCPVHGGAATPVAALTTDGTYTFSVTSTRPDAPEESDPDAVHVGGTSAPATSSYTLDRLAPALEVLPPPAGPYTGWSVAVSDATAVSLACTLAPDVPGFTCNTGLVSPSLTADGSYLLTVAATDAAGNTSTASAAYTYDGTAPEVAITPVPRAADTTPTWSFTIDGGGAPTCTLAGPGVTGSGTCGPTSYTAASLTASGTYTLTVSSTDGAGNTGTATSTYVLDITSPSITITPPGSTSGTGPTQTWTVDVGDATSATCTVDGVQVACTGPITGERLTDGTVTLVVQATDDLGNTASATASYTRSSTPAAPVVTAPPSPSSTAAVTWTFTTDALTTTVSCRLTRDGSTVTPDGPCTSFASGQGSFSTTLASDGTYTLHVTASNSSSPTSTTGTASYTLDATEPDGPELTATHSGTTGNASPLTWTWTPLPEHTTQCRLTVAGSAGSWADCSGSFTVTPTTQGSHLLEVRYYDSLGNTGTPSTASYLYDSVGPTTPTVTLVGGSPRQPGEVTWNVSTSPDVARTECRVIGPGVLASSVAWTTCSLPIVRTLSGDGAHELQVRQVDAVGNLSAVVSSTVVLDGTPPTAPSFSGTGSRGTNPTLTWTFAQTGDGTSFRCRLLQDGVGPATFTACASNYTVTVEADGSYQLQVVAVDAVGNVSAVASGPVHVVDRTGPAAPTVTLAVTSGNTPSATWAVTPAESGTTSQCRLTLTAGGSTTEVLAWSACTGYTFALDAGDGVYVLQVRTLDDLGNVGAVATGPGYTLDATPPAQPTVTGSRSGTDNERQISYAFAGEGTATCRLYRGNVLVETFAGCHLPQPFVVTLPAVDGTYTLQVTFTDAFGNTSTPGVSQPYTLDVTPPATPTVVGSRSGTDNETGISYAFTGEGTALCRLYRDGVLVQTYTGCHTSAPFAVTLPSTSGQYVLTVTFTDAYGNVGEPGSSQPYVLDVTPPGLATVTVSPATGNVRSATWTVTAPEPGTTSECRLRHVVDGVSSTVQDWAACAAPYTFALTRDDGLYVLDVRLTDAVGNLGGVATGQGYLLDVTPPAAPVVTSNRTGTDNERSVSYFFSGEGTATCQLTKDGAPRGSAVVGCTSGYTVTLPDESGSYALLVTYTDAVGNTGAPGSSPVYELDVTPPLTPVVTSDRTGTDNERVVTYVFSGEGDATCRLLRDGVPVGTPVPCTSPWVLTLPTVDGSYVLQVTYTDAVGNVSAPGASPPYLLDLTPPPAPTVLGPGGTGNQRSVSWTFSGEGTATCTLLLDGVAAAAPVTGCTSGYTVTLPADGSWSLRVTYTDAVGNTGPPGVSPPYLLDTVAPAAPRLSGPTGPAQGRTPSWTVVTDVDTTTDCRLVRGGTVVRDWASCGGTVGADLTGLPDGAYVLESRATDRAGNVGPVGSSAPYVLDTTPPPAPVVSGPTGPSQARSPTFTWTGESGARAECRLSRDGAVVGGWVACSSGHTPVLDADGTWMLSVRLVDAAGNVGPASASPGYVLDTTPPPAPTVTPPKTPGRDTSPSWGAVVEGGSTVECRLSGPQGEISGWAPCVLPLVTSLIDRPDGTYLLEVRATDAAGNLSPVGRGSYLLDTVAPAAAVITSPTGPGRTRSPSFAFTVEPGATTRCRLTSGGTLVEDFLPCTSPVGLDLTGLPDGTYTLTVRVTDAAGNPGPAATGTYVLDTTAPAAPVLTLSPAGPSPARRLTWAFTFEPGGSLQCRLTTPTGAVRDIVGCTSPLPVDLTGLPDGTYTLTVRAVDAAGNVGAPLSLTHVLDSTATAGPTVTGPSTPGSTRTPTWTLSSGSTECRLTRGATVLRDWFACTGGSWTADLFGQPDGTYALAVRLRTATGVSAATVSSYVLDTTAPGRATLVAPPTPSTNRAPTWSVASAELGARAECRVLVFGSVLRDWTACAVSVAGALHPVDLTGLGDGTYTLVVRLTDAAGNRGPETSSSYVLDTSAPVAVGVTGPPSPGNDDTPTWRLSSGSGAELECRLTLGAAVVQDWTPCEGEFTADLAERVDGTYTLHVRALSAAGTPGPETSSDYVLSRKAPGAVVGLTLSGTTSPGNSRRPTWTFTLPQGTTGWCTVTSAGRLVFEGPCTSPFVLDLSRASDGAYTLTVRAVSAAGTPGAPVTSTYTLDTRPTERPVLTLTPGDVGSSLDPQWRFTVVYGATAQCRLLYEGRATDDWFDCATGTFTAFLTGRPDGRYTLEVRARDAAGNTSEPRAHTYRLDRTAAPVVAFAVVPETPSQDRVVRWTFSAPEGSSLECRVVGPDGTSAWAPCSAVAVLGTVSAQAVSTAGSYRLDLTGRPDGVYVLEVRVVDVDGRRGSVSRATYALDTTRPAAPGFTARPVPAGNVPTASWSWDAGDVQVDCRLTRDGVVVSAWAPCSSPFQVDLSRLGDGTYTLSIRVVDAADNLGDVSSASYLYDTQRPAPPVFTSRPTSGADRSVSWTFTVPPDATATCRVTRGVTVVVRASACDGRYDLSLVGLPDGVYTLTVTYRDRAGNLSLPTSGQYTLVSTARGPIRTEPPPAGPGSGGGAAPAPGRGGTGVAVPVPRGSTPAAGVPTIPSDEDVPVSSAARPRTFAPDRSSQEVTQGDDEQPAGAAPRSRNPLPPLDFPIRDVVTGTITRPTLPLALLAVVVLFLLAQNRIDRRDPKLAYAPVEAEPELDFTFFIRRPGGALP